MPSHSLTKKMLLTHGATRFKFGCKGIVSQLKRNTPNPWSPATLKENTPNPWSAAALKMLLTHGAAPNICLESQIIWQKGITNCQLSKSMLTTTIATTPNPWSPKMHYMYVWRKGIENAKLKAILLCRQAMEFLQNSKIHSIIIRCIPIIITKKRKRGK